MQKDLNMVFMGTPDLAATVLQALLEDGYKVSAVVTQPDKPKGRGKALAFSPVKELALKHNIPVLQPERAKDEAFVEELRAFKPDIITVAAYGKILPKAILDMPKYGCIQSGDRHVNHRRPDPAQPVPAGSVIIWIIF